MTLRWASRATGEHLVWQQLPCVALCVLVSSQACAQYGGTHACNHLTTNPHTEQPRQTAGTARHHTVMVLQPNRLHTRVTLLHRLNFSLRCGTRYRPVCPGPQRLHHALPPAVLNPSFLTASHTRVLQVPPEDSGDNCDLHQPSLRPRAPHALQLLVRMSHNSPQAARTCARLTHGLPCVDSSLPAGLACHGPQAYCKEVPWLPSLPMCSKWRGCMHSSHCCRSKHPTHARLAQDQALTITCLVTLCAPAPPPPSLQWQVPGQPPR